MRIWRQLIVLQWQNQPQNFRLLISTQKNFSTISAVLSPSLKLMITFKLNKHTGIWSLGRKVCSTLQNPPTPWEKREEVADSFLEIVSASKSDLSPSLKDKLRVKFVKESRTTNLNKFLLIWRKKQSKEELWQLLQKNALNFSMTLKEQPKRKILSEICQKFKTNEIKVIPFN